MKSIIQFILKTISKAILWRHEPLIIAITGSVGKTNVKEAIFTILSRRFKVHAGAKNYNNEIGVPLAIIGTESGGKSFWQWTKVILRGLSVFIQNGWNFPKILILEMGADKPGDIRYLTSIAKPQISVVTAIGEMPAHIEFFPERDALIKEKFNLLDALPPNGIAILNYDDLSVRDMKRGLSDGINVLTYGFGSGAAVKGDNFAIQGIGTKDMHMSIKVEFKGSAVPLTIPNLLGSSQAYAVLAAVTVSLSLGMNLVEIGDAVRDYSSPSGRMKLLPGIKSSLIIDDSYNSSPVAADAALETLVRFKDYRKIAVLGDMLELGEYTEKAHRELGQKAARICDLIIAVGPRAQFICQEVLSLGFNKERVFCFDQHEVEEAGKLLQEKIKKDDVVLIKGSQSMRMEQIVKEVMAEPEKAKGLLVRQEWEDV